MQRKRYMDKLITLKDEKVIKVITGIRRCGKSTLLLLFQEYLKQLGVEDARIIYIDFEDFQNEHLLDHHKLYEYVTSCVKGNTKTYVFLDEIQNVKDFQKVVDSLYANDSVDLYLTSSSAYLSSGDFSALLSDRYIEIKIFPLSFEEYFGLKGEDKREAFTSYCLNGAFPQAGIITDDKRRADYLQGIYSTILLKDVMAQKRVSDVDLLERVIRFIFDNAGNNISSNKVAASLRSLGRKTTSVTVENYISALMDAYVIYKVPRYDIKGKQQLKSLEKYYAVDTGLRYTILGERNRDIERILENTVYLELIRRGYTVNAGKLGEKEIDFIATVGGTKEYYQVAATVPDSAAFEREYEPLLSIKDNYPKYVLTMDDLSRERDGIKQVNIIDFLLST